MVSRRRTATLAGLVALTTACGGRVSLEAADAVVDASFDDAAVDSGHAVDARSDSAADTCAGRCGGDCVDVTKDPENCGACGNRCDAPPSGAATCTGGKCSFVCEPDFHPCGLRCSPNADVSTCGDSCTPCAAAPLHGVPTCDGSACGFECDDGYARSGDACVLAPPRPLAPLSTATVTSRRPTLRWKLGVGDDGARIEVCGDRACTRVLETIDATGSSARPTADLPSGAVFWRLRGRVGGVTRPLPSATWEMFVCTHSAPTDTSGGTTLDVNGDGLPDLAIASDNWTPLTTGSVGRLYLFHGAATGLPKAAATVLTGVSQDERFGQAFASAGDVNGDGFGDFMVTGWGANKVYVYHGGPSGISLTPSVVLQRSDGGDSAFGFSLSSAGDVDGDGYGDVVIGAMFYLDSKTREGRAYVMRGGPHGLASTVATIIDSREPSSWFGSAAAGLGDVNADGYGDFAIGAKFGDTGHAYVFLGGPTGVPTAPAISITGSANSGLGASIAGAGDVNGDGLADLIVGTEPIAIADASALVFLGNAKGVDVTAPVHLHPTGKGTARVAGAGDVDGDGFADVIVGAYAARTIGLYTGSAVGVTPSRSTIMSESANGFGYSLARLGDVDGDGLGDIVVGTSTSTIFESGSAFVYSGRSPATSLPLLSRYDAPDGYNFGIAVGGSSGP